MIVEQLLILFFIKHFLVDFLIQTEYQWKNKGTFLHPGGLIHSGLHGLTAYIILLGTTINPAWAFFDFLTHYCIDFTKTNINKKFNLSSQDQIFWVLVGFDQLLHYIVYTIIIF